jgi:peptidoglycan/LPS O-acetylase OafA/YrhL
MEVRFLPPQLLLEASTLKTPGTDPAPSAAAGSGAASEYAAYRERRYFPSLDGVRAVAIIFVFTGHVAYSAFWGTFFGGDGVTVFFVLSGFLITTLALREEERRGRLSLRSFYVRRIFRIYPVYFAILALYVVLIFGAGFVADRRALFDDQLPYYLFGFPEHGFFDIHGGLESGAPYAGAWSIGIEEKFYLVWPLLGFVFLRGAFRARIAVCLVGVVLCAVAPSITHAGVYVFEYVFIILGVIAALLLHERRWFTRLAPLGRRRAVLAMFAVFVAFELGFQTVVGDNGPVRLAGGLVIAFTLIGVVLSQTGETAWLRSGPMVLLGKVSFVFYLTHNFALNLVEKTPLGRPTLLYSIGDVLVAFPLAVLIAWVIHVTFERPLVRVGHKLAHRDKPFHGV